MDFFLCLSIYFDFMPTDIDGYPYPLKINIELFGHKGVFYIMSRAQIFPDPGSTGKALERCLYIFSNDQDFEPTKHGTKMNKATNTFNFEAYKGISFLLNGDVEAGELQPKIQKSKMNKESSQDQSRKALESEIDVGINELKTRQSLIGKYILEALDGIDNQPDLEPKLFPMRVIRAMWMAVIIPFVAETAPPSDEAIQTIESVHSDLMKGATFDAEMEKKLKGLGGANPGCHKLCYYLYDSIRKGNNTFKKVLIHPHANRAEFTPSMQRGIHEYRKSMFNNSNEALLKLAAEIDQVRQSF